jgi:hypothetical protein
MPNFFSAFTSEVFRPLATLLVPGSIGISTWLIGLLWTFPSLKGLVSANHTESSLVVVLGVTFAGLVFEDFGSRIEEWLDHRADNATNGEHIRNWFRYLRTSFVADPIGRRYIRTLVLRLKFELGIAFSMLSAMLGIVWLVWLGLACRTAIPFLLLAVGFCTWELVEAAATHKLLACTRAELLKEIRVVR